MHTHLKYNIISPTLYVPFCICHGEIEKLWYILAAMPQQEYQQDLTALHENMFSVFSELFLMSAGKIFVDIKCGNC